MANELTVTCTLEFLKSGIAATESLTKTLTVTGSKYVRGVQAIGTSEEALGIGDLGTLGYCILINRDATNFVEVRMGSSAADVIKIKAGEFALFRMAGNTPYMIADTGTCNVEFIIIED